MDIKRDKNICELIGIEYPGRVENVDNMIDTLGGIQELSKGLEEKQRLQLKLNPKNLYCKPAFSSQQEEATGMLLKLKVRRVKNNPKTKVEYLSAEIVGTVKSMYKFNNFCDYQYLPMQKNEATGETENLYHDIVPEDILTSPRWFREKPNIPLFLPPVVFSRSDNLMQTSMLRNEQKLLTASENDEIVKFAVTNRSSRRVYSTMIVFDMKNPIPTAPKESVASNMSHGKENDFKAVAELFERRPIWTLAALRAHIREPKRRISNILASIAYFYSNGPWRNCFVKFGYDPRQSFESRYYQMLDYRVRQGAGFKTDVKLKRPSALNKLIRGNPKNDYPDLLEDEIEAKFQQRRKEAIFNSDSIPPFRARHYQLIDVHLPKVQEMLENIPSPLSGTICNERRGWLPPRFLEDTRDILTTIAQANMMKLCKEKNISLDEISLESVASEQNEEELSSGSEDEDEEMDEDDDEEEEENLEKVNPEPID